jgi:hypothetical protein
MHLMNIKEISQAQWASTQLKPKHTTPRFNKLLLQRAFEQIDDLPIFGLIHIMQGFRGKQNKALYEKLRKTLIDRRQTLFPGGAENEESVKHLANAWFMFAQGRPRNHGVYKHYASDDLEELIAHFEHDLCDAAEKADADHLTRFAQAMYILKTSDYENIWWRIESRTNELASKGELTFYHATNILRAFSRS